MGLDGVFVVSQLLAYRLIKVKNSHTLAELLRKEPYRRGDRFRQFLQVHNFTTGY